MRNLYLIAAIVLLAPVRSIAQCGTTPVAGDLIIATDTELSGTYNVTGTFRVEPGITVTVTSYANNGCGELVINAANIEVIGDIDADGAGFPGGAGGTGGNAGNNVGALTGCVDKDNCLVIDVNGGTSGSDGAGPGAGLSGNGGQLGIGPKQECQNFGDEYGFVGGAGGAGGAAGGSYGAASNAGGPGGGGAAYNPGNFSGMDIAGCASPAAGGGGTGGAAGTAYGTQVGTDIAKGSGGAGAGGGGKSAGNGGLGGSGGTGGGLVSLNASGNLTVQGNISANGTTGGAGGNGGNGGTTTDCCSDTCNDCGERTLSSGAGGGAGGGGGSGGGILLQASGVADVTGTLRVIGGAGGDGGNGGSGTSGCSYSNFFCGSNSGSANAGASGDLGGGGSGGRIKIFQNPCQPNNINPTILRDGGTGNSGAAGDGTYHLGDLGNITPPTLSVTVDPVSCFGLDDGGAEVVVNGGTAPFTYTWSVPGNQSTISGLSADTYEVTVVDGNLCEVTETVVIPEPDTLTVLLFGPVQPGCFGASTGEISAMGMGGTSPYSYQWDDPSLQNTPTATGLEAGDYVVTVTDANSCVATDTATIDNPAPFAATVTIDQEVSCFGADDAQVTVTATGQNLTYQWDDPAQQQTGTASGLPAGTWNVTIASSSQTCDTTFSVTLTQPDSLVLIAVEGQQVSCNGGDDGIATVTELGGTAPFTYQWDDPDLQDTQTATGLAAGDYNVVVTDDNQCSATASVTITEASPLSIAVQIEGATCNGASDAQVEAVVTGGTPGYTYEWSPGGPGNPLTGIAAGSYDLTVTDANGCTGTFQNAIVPEPAPIILSLIQQSDVSCFGASDGSAEISATGGTTPYTYIWDDPSAQGSALAGGLSPGTYSVEVTDANGCSSEWQNVEITEPDQLDVTATSQTPVTCEGGNDGLIETETTGGTPPYSFQWNDPSGQTGSTAIDLEAGDYTLTVTDANGCVQTVDATVGAPLLVLDADFAVSPESGEQPIDIVLTNNSEGGTAYEWIFGDGNTVTTFDTSTVEYMYADSGSFTITLVAINETTGCTDTMTIENAVYAEPTSAMLVPNVITPNGDGLNDVFPIDPTDGEFFPFRIRNIYDFVGTVYNRWGEKVYEWTQPLGGWDGRSTSGLELQQGTYYYVITAKGVDGDAVTKYEFTGNVTLLR